MKGVYCGEPEVQQCTSCVEFYKPHPGLKHFVEDAKGNVAQYRETLARILARSETIFVGAEDAVLRMRHHEMPGNYSAVSHPVTKGSIFAKSRNLANKSFDEGQVKVALFGGISDIKGFHVLLECADIAAKKNLPLHFIVFGYTANDDLCRAHANIEVLGQYQDKALDGLIQKHRPHLSFFPNQWPETFSYTLSHSIRLGIWPIVSDIGAPAERVKNLKFGNVFDLNLSAENICHLLIDHALHGRVRNAD
jgi:glycosyltransferase involved in cell wall biosynthesis